MATNLNLDSLSVDSRGRVSFSGLNSGIDAAGAVDGIMAARRIPIDSIEQRISDNDAKIAILGDIEALTRNLLDAVDGLSGKVSFDGSSDIFETKSVFASSRRSDAQSPSAAAEILGASTTNRAQATGHTIEVVQVASAHKIASDSIAGTTGDPLGLQGTFEINGVAISIGTDDSLLDLRDRINSANRGDNASGVTASIITISANEHILTLTADETGTDAAITLTDSGGVAAPGDDEILLGLGIIDSGSAIKNQLQAANNAQIRVDGLEAIGGVDVIERQTNTIDDVLDGVTLSLFKAEAGTTVTLDVEPDLNQVKSSIVDMVDAYNELRTYINTQAQSEIEDEDGEIVEGLLAGTSVLSEIRSKLSNAIGGAVQGGDAAFSSLAEIGITILGKAEVGNPLLANTLAIDEAKLDEALLNRPDAVRDLFAFDFSSSSSDVLLVGFSDRTQYSQSGYTLNVAYADGAIVSANIGGNPDGSDDGSVQVDGKRLTVLSGDAEGLQVLYNGNASASGIQLDLSVGVGAQIQAAATQLLDNDSGTIGAQVDTLTQQNERGQARIERMEERLERQREIMLNRFAAMESALASMNTLLESIRSQIDAAFGNNS
ncbi:MAG: flagellar filament capping protein FliD [Alphaproteobacteria bacterium]